VLLILCPAELLLQVWQEHWTDKGVDLAARALGGDGGVFGLAKKTHQECMSAV